MYGSLLCQEMLYRSPGGLREPSHSHHVGPDGGQHLQIAGLQPCSPSQGDSSVRFYPVHIEYFLFRKS